MEYLPIVRYLVAFAIFTAIGAPIAVFVFRDLPDRGAAFVLPTVLIEAVTIYAVDREAVSG